MIFSEESLEKMFAWPPGKWQTRRLVKPGDYALFPGYNDFPYKAHLHTIASHPKIPNVYRNGRLLYEVGRTYAVQPGRGKRQVGRFKLLRIRYEDVRDISLEDAKAEGFKNEVEFWEVWCEFHDPPGFDLINKPYFGHWIDFKKRPTECYQAWALDFEMLPGARIDHSPLIDAEIAHAQKLADKHGLR